MKKKTRKKCVSDILLQGEVIGPIPIPTKVDDAEVISFLLSKEIVPVCLHNMEIGSELSKMVATFIVHKILLNEVGIGYMCEHFLRARGSLEICLPEMFMDPSFSNCLGMILPQNSVYSNCYRMYLVQTKWLQAPAGLGHMW